MIKRKKTHCQRLYQDGCLSVGDTIYIISTAKGLKAGSETVAKELYRSLEFIPKQPPWNTYDYPFCFKSQLLDLAADGQYEELAHYIPHGITNPVDAAEYEDYLRDLIETSIEWVPVVAIWIGED
jgi:hypothetical protein